VVRGHRHRQAGFHGRRYLEENFEHRLGNLGAPAVWADQPRTGIGGLLASIP
jgi:hypothetical protein